jgi:hypothetical protein
VKNYEWRLYLAEASPLVRAKLLMSVEAFLLLGRLFDTILVSRIFSYYFILGRYS